MSRIKTISPDILLKYNAANYLDCPIKELHTITDKQVRVRCFQEIIYNMLQDPDLSADLGSRGISTEYCEALAWQAAHETGYFTSNLYRNYNNAFGMQVPKQRDFYGLEQGHKTAEGTAAVYASPLQSIVDRIVWDEYADIHFTDIEEYLFQVQQKGYATDPQYIEKIMKMYSNYHQWPEEVVKKNIPWTTIVTLIGAIGGILALLKMRR